MSKQRIVVGMMDGLDMEYLDTIKLPRLNRMMRNGFFTTVGGVFPSVTNVNNVSIACGAWPKDHGISANSFYNKQKGKPEYMNSGALIRCPTIFERARKNGVKSALLTSKKKTLELFQHDVDLGIAAEAVTEAQIEKYGLPADIYSKEINYWLWQVAIDILANEPHIGLIYVHITDYPMHAWGPEETESFNHLTTLDQLIGDAMDRAPDAAFFATADHGMNYKTRCWDLEKVLKNKGVPARFVLSPERDYYVVHHRNFTGCSWIWLNSPEDQKRTIDIVSALEGVEEVISREQAVDQYHLIADHIGDLIVMGDRRTMFGEMDMEFEELPPTYRAHGSLYEMNLPLLIWNYNDPIPDQSEFNYNLDLTRFLYR
ncbi:MAG: nucleotide pyrophosphatase [Desulfobulbaceae bacterium]|nr:MAG: nucleotide pyrophosphatase [Desulfobulbaceae bacterium]